jgi:hypothetical protein
MAHNVPDNVPDVASNSPEVVASHPERLWILGGVWLAIASIGFMGSATLINPEVKLPVIDPLLKKLDRSSDKPHKTLTFEEPMEHLRTLSPVVPMLPAVEKLLPETLVLPEIQAIAPLVVTNPPAPTTHQPTVNTPTAPKGNVPIWAYGIIIASCAVGSSLITYSLYRLSRLASVHRQGKARRRVKPNQSRSPVRQSATTTPVGQPVAAIAPLRIQAPTNVEPLQVQLEPVIDPQPVRKKISRAEQLAHLAQQAKQQKPKSLVELMDIRRRDSFAPFP